LGGVATVIGFRLDIRLQSVDHTDTTGTHDPQDVTLAKFVVDGLVYITVLADTGTGIDQSDLDLAITGQLHDTGAVRSGSSGCSHC